MNSPEHLANILDSDYTQIGVGVTVDRSGIIWVTEDFRQPMGSTPAPSTSSSTSGSSQPSSSAPASTSAPSTYAAAAPVAAAQAKPVLSPRQLLMQRLHQLRRHHHAHTGDPVAQAFHYVSTLSRLTA
jgi:hypothetical protein